LGQGNHHAAIGFARDGTLVTSGGNGVRIWEPDKRLATKKN